MSKPLRVLPILVAMAACGDRGPPVWAPTAPVASDLGDGCVRARALRDRVAGLLSEGRLDRATRALSLAEGLCPRDAPLTWATQVTALAELGRSAEALQLADRIARSDRSDDAARSAAAVARSSAEVHAREASEASRHRVDPELFDPAEKRRSSAGEIFRRGLAAKRSGDLASAKPLFLEAWTTFHPNPRALIEAGLAARALGNGAEAQRLWDRAAYDDATIAIRPEPPTTAPVGIAATTMAWSIAGDHLAVAGDGSVRVFDASLHAEMVIEMPEAVTALAFSREGLLFIGQSGGVVRVVDTATGAAVRELPGAAASVVAIAPSPSASQIGIVALALGNGKVQILDLRTAAPPVDILVPTGTPAALAWNHDGTRLAVGTTFGGITVHTFPALAKTIVRPIGARVLSLAFSPAGDPQHQLTAVTSTGVESLAVRPTRQAAKGGSKHGKTRGKPQHHASAKRASPAAVGLAAASVLPSEAGHDALLYTEGDRLVVWDIDSRAPLASRPIPGILAIAVAPGAKRAAAISKDRTLRVFSPRDASAPIELYGPSPLAVLTVSAARKELAALSSDGAVVGLRLDPEGFYTSEASSKRATAVAFSPSGRFLAIAVDDPPRIELHDPARGDLSSPVSVRTPAGRITAIDVAPDGSKLAALTLVPSVQVFDAATDSRPLELPLHAGPGRALRFSPDGRALLVAGRDTPLLWEPDAQKTQALSGYGTNPEEVAFFADGRRVAVASPAGALFLGTPSAVAAVAPQSIPIVSRVLGIAVSADGGLVTAEADRSLVVRSSAGRPTHRFTPPDAAISAVALMDPKTVVVALADGTLRFYRAPADRPFLTVRTPFRREVPLRGAAVSSEDGHIAFLGPDAASVRAGTRCRIGAMLVPFDVCAEQYEQKGLLGVLMAGKDPAEVDP